MTEGTQEIVYCFGSFRVNAVRRQMSREYQPLTVTAKAFDTLIELLKHSGEVVSKDDLMSAVWPDTIVEENNLIQQISYLRKLFREGGDKFIVTIPGRGYTFAAAVSRDVETGDLRSAVSIPLRRDLDRRAFAGRYDPGRLTGYSLAAAFIMLVCLPVFWEGAVNRSKPARAQSVAVLRFKSFAGDEYIGSGISDTLRARLGSVQDLIVRPGPDELSPQDLITAGRQLNVDTVLTGSVQRADERIRVTVEMIDVGNGRIVWGGTFDSTSSNLFELQDSIVGEVSHYFQARFTSAIFNREPTIYEFSFLRPASMINKPA